MTILVTGASGKLGGRILDELLARAPASELIATTRTPAALGRFQEDGVEIRYADFDRPETLAPAFEGATRMLLMSTDSLHDRGAQQRAAVDAARAAGVELVAYTSYVQPNMTPDGLPSSHSSTETALRESGLRWCFLRSSVYAELEAGNLEVARSTGRLVTNHGAGKIGYVSRDDCAAAAAVVLAEDGHSNAIYDLTGPEGLDAADRVAIFSDLLGREIELVQIDEAREPELTRLLELGRFGTFEQDERHAAGLAETGMPPEAAAMFASFGRYIREGHLDRVSPDVRKLTGRTPRSLRDVLEQYLS